MHHGQFCVGRENVAEDKLVAANCPMRCERVASLPLVGPIATGRGNHACDSLVLSSRSLWNQRIVQLSSVLASCVDVCGPGNNGPCYVHSISEHVFAAYRQIPWGSSDLHATERLRHTSTTAAVLLPILSIYQNSVSRVVPPFYKKKLMAPRRNQGA